MLGLVVDGQLPLGVNALTYAVSVGNGRGIHPLDTDFSVGTSAGRQLLSIIASVLALAKIEAGRVELYVQPFRVEDLCTELEAIVSPLAAAVCSASKPIDRSPSLETRASSSRSCSTSSGTPASSPKGASSS